MNPLPQRYLIDEPGVGGRIKLRPEDFLVDEIPLYEPAGEGEHLYLRVQKTRVSHSEMMSCLRRHFGVPERAIGFAGMKDKHGVTRQTVSVLLGPGGEAPDLEMAHDRIAILWASRHRNKLRRGHLRGNRFAVRIREVNAIAAPRVARVLRRLEEVGVPSYFGPQRFGYRRNNHLLGRLLVRQDWPGILDELLGSRGSPFPDYQRERRARYDAGRYEEAAAEWTAADRVELSAIKALRAGRAPRQACEAIRGPTFSFWVSALQSASFNRVLDARIDEGTVGRLRAGDLAWKHDSRRVFPVTASELASPELSRRLEAFEVSPSGPLWGTKMPRPEGAVAEAEREALHAFELEEDELLESRWAPPGARRPLRVRITNVDVDAGMDEHGHYVRVAFDLPPGAYATVVLREIMKDEKVSGTFSPSQAVEQSPGEGRRKGT